MLNELCSFAERHSLTGCEFLVGIPGTIGGSAVQNAGAFGKSISGIIREISCVDGKGNLRKIGRDKIGFGYRETKLGNAIVVGATLRFIKGDKKAIRNRIKENIAKRLATQDYSAPSAGCIFKNPLPDKKITPEGRTLSAGELIDRCGLKGFSVGGAAVSQKHANFIINKKHAKAVDILRLISIIKKTVKKRFGIELEEEVKIIK